MKPLKAQTPSIRKTPKADEVEKSLEAIYEENGKLPDFAKLETRERPYLWLIIFGICTFFAMLIAAIWFGFLLFKPFRGFQGDGLRIVIDGSDKISLGEENTYFINWQNMANEPLANAELRINFPMDFKITSIEPTPTDAGQNLFRLGSVPYGGRGSIAVRGMYTGALGTKTAVQVVGSYRPASFNSDFEALSTQPIEYVDSVLEGHLDVPLKALPGDRVIFTYTLLNRGSSVMKDLETHMRIPAGFIHDATSTAGQFEGEVLRTPRYDLAAGASTTLSLTGTFATGFSGDAALHVETGKVSESGLFLPAQTSETNLSVLAGDLSLKLVVNGSDANRSLPFGEMQHVSLAYENTSPEELRDVTLALIFEPDTTGTEPIDWSKLEQMSSGTRMGNSIVWDAHSSAVFEKLVPQADGTLEFSVPAVSATVSTTRAMGFRLSAEARMTLGSTSIKRTIRTTPIQFRFRTDAALTSEARFSSEEGAPLGTGPLPPEVGQTTRYRIQWEVAKTVHELKNVRVSAELPKRISWIGVASTTAGEVQYDEASRVVTWTLNRMPKDVEDESVGFDIAFTPSDLDVGRFGQLLGEARFEATDADISEPIVQNVPRLSTDLPSDEMAKSKGVVKKP